MLLVRFLPVILIWDIKIGLVFMDGSSFDKYRKNCNASGISILAYVLLSISSSGDFIVVNFIPLRFAIWKF
jgi:hypothetical protein